VWAAVERAYERWHELGEPDWDCVGLSVTNSEQRVWFGTPHGSHSWLLPDDAPTQPG